MVSFSVPQRKGDPKVLLEDEFPKPQTSLEGLSKLKTIYDSPSVTPGNSPGLDAGGAGLVITKRKTAEAKGLKILGIIESVVSVAGEPDKIA